MTACPTPESYGPAPLCDPSTVPDEPAGTVLAITGFDPLVFVIVVLSLLLLGALSFAIAALWSARGSHITAREAIEDRDTAETELANHLARHPKEES